MAIKLYWKCDHCGTYHEKLPRKRSRRYCNRKCQNAAFYAAKKGDGNA